MIDTHDQVMSTPPSRSRRRTAHAPATGRSLKSAPSTKKTLPIERVFSDAKVKPFDQIEWEKVPPKSPTTLAK